MTQLYIYIHSSSYSPLWFITGYWIQFPVLYGRTLLFMHSVYNNLHLLIPNPHCLPLPHSNHSLFSKSDSVSVLWMSSFVSYFRYTYQRSHMVFILLWLSSLSMIFSRSIYIAANVLQPTLESQSKQTHQRLWIPEGKAGVILVFSINHSHLYNSVVLRTFTMLYNHHFGLVLKHFHHPRMKPLIQWVVTPFPPLLHPWQPLACCLFGRTYSGCFI